MDYADIFRIPVDGHYEWRWLSADGTEWSSPFMHYYDCLTDAQAHGFKVIPGRIKEEQ